MRKHQIGSPGWFTDGRRAVYILAGGALVSTALCIAFYSLLTMTHAPSAFGQPGAPPTVSQWIAAYTTWYQTENSYALCFRVCLSAAVGFGAALGIFTHPRLAFMASFFMVNFYFAWSSSTFAPLSRTLENIVTEAIYVQDGFLLTGLGIRVLTGNTYVVADIEVLALLAVVMGSVFVLNLRGGRMAAILRSVRALAFCLVILGSEIALFDYRELFLHVTQTQVVVGLATWFTNADLLLFGLALFAATTLLLRSHRVPVAKPLPDPVMSPEGPDTKTLLVDRYLLAMRECPQQKKLRHARL